MTIYAGRIDGGMGPSMDEIRTTNEQVQIINGLLKEVLPHAILSFVGQNWDLAKDGMRSAMKAAVQQKAQERGIDINGFLLARAVGLKVFDFYDENFKVTSEERDNSFD